MKLKLPMTIVAFIATVLVSTAAHADALTGVCGDITNDKLVTASDALKILKAAVDSSIYCPLAICDATGDGKVSAADALLILKKSVDKSVHTYCPKANWAQVSYYDTLVCGHNYDTYSKLNSNRSSTSSKEDFHFTAWLDHFSDYGKVDSNFMVNSNIKTYNWDLYYDYYYDAYSCYYDSYGDYVCGEYVWGYVYEYGQCSRVDFAKGFQLDFDTYYISFTDSDKYGNLYLNVVPENEFDAYVATGAISSKGYRVQGTIAADKNSKELTARKLSSTEIAAIRAKISARQLSIAK
jgi:hypothetical protein